LPLGPGPRRGIGSAAAHHRCLPEADKGTSGSSAATDTGCIGIDFIEFKQQTGGAGHAPK
jgi:hypothetical protein